MIPAVIFLRQSALAGLLAGVYFIAAKLSLPLAIPPGYATAVWPPSGIALAALLVLGRRVWPGVWLGAALVNGTVEASWLAAAIIASGNTLEALAGAALIRRYIGVPVRFMRGSDVFRFIVWAALCAAIAASVGMAALATEHPVSAAELARNWWTWWQGDACGIIIVTPLILSWYGRTTIAWHASRVGEAALFACLLLAATQIVFGRPVDDLSPLTVPFMILPMFIWAAFRFGQREVTAAIAAVCAIAVWHTLEGRGPFAAGSLNQSLLVLLSFICVSVFTGLLLSAVLEERAQALRDLDGRHDDLLQHFRLIEADLVGARAAAERANDAKSEFLAKMSHELRTPLNSLLILARLMADNADGSLAPKQVQYARTIHDAGSDLLALINDVLDLAKIESGSPIVLRFEEVRLDDLRDSIEQAFRQAARDKALQFAVAIGDGLPPAIETDPRRLRQILNNLLANAFKFTPRGGVSLHLSVAAAGGIAFAVADSGIGISPGQRELVFEPFRQADGGTSRRFGGTGLGLSISRELAHLLGGEITLQNAPAGGCLFTLVLPYAAAQPRRDPPTRSAGA
jgi:signal transduction histidine kinase